MPSINLLPEDFTTEAYKHRERIAVYILASLFLLSSIASYFLVDFQRDTVAKEVESLDGSINNTKVQIEGAMEKGNLLSSDYNRSDIEGLLNEHLYLSRGLEFLKTVIIKDVYCGGLDLTAGEGGNVTMTFDINAKSVDAISNQVAVFKDSFWIQSLDFSGIEEGDSGFTANIEISVRKEKFIFQEQYWNYGIDKLANSIDREIKVSSYSVKLRNLKDKNSGEVNPTVEVTFEGSANSIESLNDFEKRLRLNKDVLKDLTINQFKSTSKVPGAWQFNGIMILNH
jgi:hypothetical protein